MQRIISSFHFSNEETKTCAIQHILSIPWWQYAHALLQRLTRNMKIPALKITHITRGED